MMLGFRHIYIISVLMKLRMLRKRRNIHAFRDSLQNGLIPLRKRLKFRAFRQANLRRAAGFFPDAAVALTANAPAIARFARVLQNAQM